MGKSSTISSTAPRQARRHRKLSSLQFSLLLPADLQVQNPGSQRTASELLATRPVVLSIRPDATPLRRGVPAKTMLLHRHSLLFASRLYPPEIFRGNRKLHHRWYFADEQPAAVARLVQTGSSSHPNVHSLLLVHSWTESFAMPSDRFRLLKANRRPILASFLVATNRSRSAGFRPECDSSAAGLPSLPILVPSR